MSFIIWLSADIVQLGDNGRTAPYAGLQRTESYLLPEGKYVRHVHICQPTFLSPQYFHLSTILTCGEKNLSTALWGTHNASDKLIRIYRAQTYCTSFWSERVWCEDSLGTHCHVHTTPTPERGWTKLRLSERCSSSTKAVWNTCRKLSVNIPIHLKGAARLVQRPMSTQFIKKQGKLKINVIILRLIVAPSWALI